MQTLTIFFSTTKAPIAYLKQKKNNIRNKLLSFFSIELTREDYIIIFYTRTFIYKFAASYAQIMHIIMCE